MKKWSFEYILPVSVALLAVFAAISINLPKSRGGGSDGVARYLEVCADGTDESCKTLAAIKAKFGIDLRAEIDARHQSMKATARKIAKGEMAESDYRSCVRAGRCPELPPPGEALQQLVGQEALTPEICAFIPACALGLKNGSFEIYRLKPEPAVRP